MPIHNYPVSNLYVFLHGHDTSRLIFTINFSGEKFTIIKSRDLSSKTINRLRKIASKYREIDSDVLTWNNYVLYRFGNILLIGEIKKREYMPYAIGFLRRVSKPIYRAIMKNENIMKVMN